MSRSTFRPSKPSLQHMTEAPRPSKAFQKFSQSLPLVLHLILSSIYISWMVFAALISHLFDGGIKESWSLITTAVHAMMKALLSVNPPQGRHSFDIVRFATSFKLPNFIFSKSRFSEFEVSISGSAALSKTVQEALKIDHKLNYTPIIAEERKISGEWVVAKGEDGDEDRPVVVYIHGGAHIFLSPNSHRSITTKVAETCKARVFCPDYRLAPEAPFPSAVEDVLACYLALTGLEVDGIQTSLKDQSIVSPSRIYLMGDSSGACLILQFLQALKALHLSMPGGAVLISPFLDAEMKSSSWHDNWESDFMSLDMAGVRWAMSQYANGLAGDHPAINPLKANLKGLPPILVQAGDSEVVTEDAIEFHKLASKAGNQVELQLYEHMFHVFHTFPFLSQSTVAFKQASAFLKASSQAQDCLSDSGISLDSISESENTVWMVTPCHKFVKL